MARRSTRPWERRHLLSTDWGQGGKVRYLDTSGPSMARHSTRPWERRHLLSTDWGYRPGGADAFDPLKHYWAMNSLDLKASSADSNLYLKHLEELMWRLCVSTMIALSFIGLNPATS